MSKYEKNELKYLEILSERFPTVQSVCTEIINLEAIPRNFVRKISNCAKCMYRNN